jgi:HNH endonuclease
LARRRRGSPAASLRRRVEKRARWRCEYCHAPQRVSGYRFHIEHIIPTAQDGSDVFPNRALACATCNLAKADKMVGTDPQTLAEVGLFNPRTQAWQDHFRWAKDQHTLIGRSRTGRATVATLNMNSDLHQEARRLRFQTGWLP